MRITSLQLYSSNSTLTEPIAFSLSDADEGSQYIVRNITGLDAENIMPKFQGFSLHTKSRYFNFRLNAREIAIRLTLNPRFILSESYSDIRDELYKTISATRTALANMQFLSGATTVAQLWGYITKYEASYFDGTPEVQLTFTCADPLFRAINPVDYAPGEFPTSSPVHIPDSLSTAPHGFKMELVMTDAFPIFTIQDKATNWEWAFNIIPAGGFHVGDHLYFCSEYSDMQLYIKRGTTTIYLMDSVFPGSVWPILFPGDNEFYFNNLSQFDWETLEYYPAYWGV